MFIRVVSACNLIVDKACYLCVTNYMVKIFNQ